MVTPPTGTEPKLVVISGLSGSGKTTLANALARALNLALQPAVDPRVLSSDVIRKEMFGVPLTTRLPRKSYTPQTAQKVFDILYRRARDTLADGQWVIMEAVFARPEERDGLEELATSWGVALHGYWLDVPHDCRRTRVGQRPKGASDADGAVVDRQSRYDLGAIRWHRLDGTLRTETLLAQIRAGLDLAYS